MFLETEGLHFNNHVKDQTMAGNAEYKQWMLEQKQAAKEQKQAEKEKLAAERAERRAVSYNLYSLTRASSSYFASGCANLDEPSDPGDLVCSRS